MTAANPYSTSAGRTGRSHLRLHIVTKCHRLRRVPLGEFKAEDLRITIGQNVGLEYLVPLALEQLQEDPFAEGAYFPGDLLSVPSAKKKP